MARKRRSNRSAQDPDDMVAMFHCDQADDNPEAWETWDFRTTTLRMAREMVSAGTAVKLRVFSPDNGWLEVFQETELLRKNSHASSTCLGYKTTLAVGNDQPGAELTPSEIREIENFHVHAFTHDTKAPLVGNKVDEAYRRRAQKLLFGRPSQKEHSRRDREVRTWRAEEKTAA